MSLNFLVQKKIKFLFLYLLFSVFFIKIDAQEIFFENLYDTVKQYASKSLLESGDWYKIKIEKTGIYKLTYEQLKEIGLRNPKNVRIYSYGGKQLPLMNDGFNHDDMIENPIFMEKGDDEVFNEGDYILFFSLGIRTWQFHKADDMFLEHIHNYSNFVYLFLTDSFEEGLRVKTKDEKLLANYESNETDLMQCYHKEKLNPSATGKVWFSEKIAQGSSSNYRFEFKNKITTAPIFAKTHTAGRKEENTPALMLNISENNKLLKTITTFYNIDHYVYAHEEVSKFNFMPSGNKFSIKYNVSGGNSTSEVFVAYLCLNTRGYLVFEGQQYCFRDKNTLASDRTTKFTINNGGKSLNVWDVTLPHKPYAVQLKNSENNSFFTIKTDTLREFIAFSSDFLTPIYSGDDVGKVANQNLHSYKNYDMLIVSHPKFLKQAKELAELRQNELSSLIVTPEKIYNEFSSGTPDISAIRNMARMLYQVSDSQNRLKYLLLVGDGTYDNKSIISKNKNLILTYQNNNSMNEVSSYTGDDFFGLLEKGEGENIGSVDIGIGRFPVNTKEEAQSIIDKIKHYESVKSQGIWKQNLCFIADDEDSNLHLNDADFLAEKIVNKNHKEFNIDKIYLDAHKQLITSSGQKYPTVNKAIDNVIKKGALIVDYIGHGNTRILAEEEILHDHNIKSWTNYNKLPIFITASCEIGRFDNHQIISLGEWFLLHSKGGGVASLTTTRVVYADDNQDLNIAFFKKVFDKNLRLGDMVRCAKNEAYNINKRKFVLLGDPSMKVSIPENKILINNITNTSLARTYNKIPETKYVPSADTIRALEKSKIEGYIIDKNGELLDKDGKLFITIYDKPQNVSTLGNDAASYPTEFKIQNNILYKGGAKIDKGFFNFEFILPKDINYEYGKGKISLYAVLSDSLEASGFSDNIIIGGISNKIKPDNNPPEISLYLNDTTFVNGGITNENPIMLAKVSDESGINTSGIGIGHDIIATLDNKEKIKLNDFYIGDMSHYGKGKITYPFTQLSEGKHTLQLKVWDIQNNSAETTITFEVQNSENTIIKEVTNYPNPMNEFTKFYWRHNQLGENVKINIRIMNTIGKTVAKITKKQLSTSFGINPIYWDGRDSKGFLLPNGMYIYHIEMETENGKKANKSSKLIISR